jgi:hypothetical protein
LTYTISGLIYKDTVVNFGEQLAVLYAGNFANPDSCQYHLIVLEKLKNQAPYKAFEYISKDYERINPVQYIKNYN